MGVALGIASLVLAAGTTAYQVTEQKKAAKKQDAANEEAKELQALRNRPDQIQEEAKFTTGADLSIKDKKKTQASGTKSLTIPLSKNTKSGLGI